RDPAARPDRNMLVQLGGQLRPTIGLVLGELLAKRVKFLAELLQLLDGVVSDNVEIGKRWILVPRWRPGNRKAILVRGKGSLPRFPILRRCPRVKRGVDLPFLFGLEPNGFVLELRQQPLGQTFTVRNS